MLLLYELRVRPWTATSQQTSNPLTSRFIPGLILPVTNFSFYFSFFLHPPNYCLILHRLLKIFRTPVSAGLHPEESQSQDALCLGRPLPTVNWGEVFRKKTYAIEQAKVRGNVRSENVDEGQDLIFVAPEQLMHGVSHKQLLLVGFQHGFDDMLEEGQLGQFHNGLQSRGGLTSVPSETPTCLSSCSSEEWARNWDRNVWD